MSKTDLSTVINHEPFDELFQHIRNLAIASKSIETLNYTIIKEGSEFTVKTKAVNGKEASINSHKSFPGLNIKTTEQVTKLPIEQRRELVKRLHVEENLNQTEISERTLYCQKTISNDLKVLRNRGELPK
jgi:23S rRNA maturation-related 3'-5' exoribonuclease YhaM